MKYEFEYYIANEDNGKMIDENSNVSEKDYEFNSENMNKVISLLQPTRQMNQAKIDYIKESMPRLPDIEFMLNDIVDYYESVFAPKDIQDSDDTLLTRIRFFMNAKSGTGENGDAVFGRLRRCDKANTGEVRIYIKGFPDRCNNSVGYGDSFAEKLEYLDEAYGRKMWFENYLRYLLAHEMFHIFHECHYKEKNGKLFPVATEERSDIYERILKEVFAEYYATAYMKDHLRKTDTENGVIKLNHIVNTGNTRWFGCGRKKLIPGMFSEEEIATDDKWWKDNSQSEPCLSLADKNDKERPASADYAGGYVLSSAADRYHDGKQGKDMTDYAFAYDKMLNDKSDEALYDLIRLREKYMKDIVG